VDSFSETALPANWTSAERAAYDGLFAEATRGWCDGLDAQQLAEYFGEAGLQPRVLDGVWQVANPELKASAGPEEFRAYCRLVAHCQALSSGAGGPDGKLLQKGGGRLRALLRDRCLASPPPALPHLSQACQA